MASPVASAWQRRHHMMQETPRRSPSSQKMSMGTQGHTDPALSRSTQSPPTPLEWQVPKRKSKAPSTRNVFREEVRQKEGVNFQEFVKSVVRITWRTVFGSLSVLILFLSNFWGLWRKHGGLFETLETIFSALLVIGLAKLVLQVNLGSIRASKIAVRQGWAGFRTVIMRTNVILHLVTLTVSGIVQTPAAVIALHGMPEGGWSEFTRSGGLSLAVVMGGFAGFLFSGLWFYSGGYVLKFHVVRSKGLIRYKEVILQSALASLKTISLLLPFGCMFNSYMEIWIKGQWLRALVSWNLVVSLEAACIATFSWQLSFLLLEVLLVNSSDFAPGAGSFDGLLESLQTVSPSAMEFYLALRELNCIASYDEERRKPLFSDASGALWNDVATILSHPLRLLSHNISLLLEKATSTVERASVYAGYVASSNSSVSPQTTVALPLFSAWQQITWSADTLRKLLVVSQREDTYGVAQRTLADLLATLLQCREYVLTVIRRGQMMRKGGGIESGMMAADKIFEKVMTNETREAIAVADALTLAIHTVVEAFRRHVEGYVRGNEVDWDIKLNDALQEFLTGCGETY